MDLGIFNKEAKSFLASKDGLGSAFTSILVYITQKLVYKTAYLGSNFKVYTQRKLERGENCMFDKFQRFLEKFIIQLLKECKSKVIQALTNGMMAVLPCFFRGCFYRNCGGIFLFQFGEFLTHWVSSNHSRSHCYDQWLVRCLHCLYYCV